MARDQVVRLERRRLLQGLGAFSLSVAGGSLLAGCANQVAPFFAGSAGSRPELLHQIGMVKSHPDKIIAQSTDWRILNELKKELKV